VLRLGQFVVVVVGARLLEFGCSSVECLWLWSKGGTGSGEGTGILVSAQFSVVVQFALGRYVVGSVGSPSSS